MEDDAVVCRKHSNEIGVGALDGDADEDLTLESFADSNGTMHHQTNLMRERLVNEIISVINQVDMMRK